MAIKMSGMNHVMEKLNKVKMKMNDERQSEVESICIGFVFHCPWGGYRSSNGWIAMLDSHIIKKSESSLQIRLYSATW